MTRRPELRSASRTFVTLLAVGLLHAASASAQGRHRCNRKPIVSSHLAHGPDAASQDFGDVAVIVDNGLIVTKRNLFDLAGRIVRFEPAGGDAYTVSRRSGAIDPDFGPALTFGHPGATDFPGDDDSQAVAFPAGFPFFGTTYASVWVNADGNVTFGQPDFTSSDRDKVRHVLGAPRISAFLHDWNTFNALNPTGSGTIHAIVKSNPARLLATWNGVADFEGGVSSTFQLTLFATGAAEIAFASLDPASVHGVMGIAEGGGQGPYQVVDLDGPAQTLGAGAIFEAFSQYTTVNDQETAREFYKTHPDHFDFLVVSTDFPVNEFMHSRAVSSQVHGIGTHLDQGTGQPVFESSVYDFSAGWGSAGELEQVVFMNNVKIFPNNPAWLVNPPVEPYRDGMNVFQNFDTFGGPVSLDGQPMTLVRGGGSLPPDDGEVSRFFLHGGAFYPGLFSPMYAMAHEVEHRWGIMPRFMHPTKGDGFDSYDLLGREIGHWSWFVNTTVPASQFAGGPRSTALDGNAIADLGTPSTFQGLPTNLAPGERVFQTAPTALCDGYSTLDQYLMGLRRASEVGGFFYVDEPRSLITGESLDEFDPSNPLNTSVTMRAWNPMGGIAFKGKRVDLTVQNIKDFEKVRERSENPQGRRFWGPKGNLTVRYFSSNGRVDPAGDASIVLSVTDRELGDEADKIESNGQPVDVKTMAFILLVAEGPPSSQGATVSLVDTCRTTWQAYGNGPASGGRGKFDTSLHPVVH